MKKIFSFMLAALCVAPFHLMSQGIWSVKASLPLVKLAWNAKASFPGSGRVANCGFAIGNYGYVFGGTNLTSEYSDLYRFDPSGNSWIKKASMPIAGMREPTAFTIDTVAYIGLGFRSGATSHLSSMYKYSPATNSYTAIASFYQGRRAATGFAIDSLGYIVGGFEYGASADNTMYSYSPKTNKWTAKATMPGSARSYIAIGVCKGKAYAMGGFNNGTYYKDFYVYNPSGNSWTKLTDFPGSGRVGASCLVMDSMVYFGCGKNGSTVYQDWYGYNVNTNTWGSAIAKFPSIKTYGNAYFSINGKGYLSTGSYNTTLSDSTFELSLVPAGRVAACGFSIKNYGYVFGGTDVTSEYSDLYQYNQTNNTWTRKANMPIAGMREPVAFAIDSVAYVGLGFRSGATSHLSSMYKYSPATNSYTAVASFYQGRRAASAFSIDSLGYVIGGFEYGSTPDNSLYAYSSKTNKWTAKTSMPGSPRSYIAVGSCNGKGYAMGGYYNGSYFNDFYCYTPSTNSWTKLADFPTNGRAGIGCFVIDSILYFGNGIDGTGNKQNWYGYNTKSGKWFAVNNSLSNRTYGNAYFSLGKKGYVATGAFNSITTDSTWEFSFPSVSVSPIADPVYLEIMHYSFTNHAVIFTEKNTPVLFNLYDVSGKNIYTEKLNPINTEAEVKIPEQLRGVYFIEVIQGGSRRTLKVML